jgi:cellulose biosynthesis protein BcsQ
VKGKVIAVANMKGGVGKTATVVSLAEALAADGASVLVIDADAQANASLCIAGDEQLEALISDGRTVDAYLDDVLIGAKKLSFADCILDEASRVTHGGRRLRLSLLASSANLRVLERELIYVLTGKKMAMNAIVGALFRVFRHELEACGERFDYVVVDCAPGISAVTEACIRLSDLVVVPTIPDFLSSYGLEAFCATIWRDDPYGGDHRPKRPPQVLVTRRRHVKEHDKYIGLLQNENGAPEPRFGAFATVIPEATAISAALSTGGKSLTFSAKWGSALVPLLAQLARELKEAL